MQKPTSEILPPEIKLSPVGICIYCNRKDEELTDEHIIPLGLGGNLVLPQASCKGCAKITGSMEQVIQRTMLGPFRIKLGLPTRRPKERPEELELQIIRDGKIEKTSLPISEFPLMYHTIKLPPPRILSGAPQTEKVNFEMASYFLNVDPKKYLNKKGDILGVGEIDWIVFYRFLAKIGHAWAIARLGVNHFRPYLQDIILGKPKVLLHDFFKLIGGGQDLADHCFDDPTVKQLHCLETHGHHKTGIHYTVTSIQLFSFLKAPTYHVVVGETNLPPAANPLQ